MIEADGLCKYYGPFIAIEDVSFRVPRGEVVAFLGPNGAGKSTTMKILTGYLAPSAGTARIAGHDMSTDRLAGAPRLLALGARETTLLAADDRGIVSWGFDAGYPEISAGALFRPVWYENYPGAVHAWETTGHQTFESKFGFIPLVVGTIKATLYAMLFATPVAILAAIFSSQFLHPSWRARIKPVIEMMASLPSVVLGFMAGLVIAPLVERGLAPVIAGFFMVPLTLLLGAHLWQLLATGARMRLAAWRLLSSSGQAAPHHHHHPTPPLCKHTL
jgi:ABC-type uncharacterized transport system permease subunit